MAVTEFGSDYISFGTVGAASLTVYMRLRVTSYAAYGDPLTIEEAGDEAAFEYDGTTLYFYEQAGGAHNILTGTDTTTWVDVALTINGTAGTAYYKLTTATSWTSLATWTSATTANVVVGSWPTYGASLGTHLISGLKMWNAVLTTSELLQEATQLVPVRWLNLRFWNPMLEASTAHINQLSGGTDGTVTGTLANNTAQSGLSWKRQNVIYAQAAAAAGGVTSTGSLAMSTYALAGTGTEGFPGSGSLAMSTYALAGTGAVANPITASGSLAMSSYGLSGTGTETFTGSGSLAMPPYALAGTGTETFTGSGTLAMSPYGLSGTGSETFTGSGSLAMSSYELAGTGAAGGVSGSGSLAMQPYALAGTGAEGFPGSGSLAMSPYELAGTGTAINPISGTGSLAMQPYALAGAGSSAEAVTGSGSLAMSSYALSGAADLGTVIEIFRTVGLPPNRPRVGSKRPFYRSGHKGQRFVSKRRNRS